MATAQLPTVRRRCTIDTRTLLGCAVLTTPVWATVALAQAATRDGYDITRHPLSVLSNGSLGWVQIANFLLVGALFVAGAAGLRRVVDGKWVAGLVRVAGFGMIAAGVFVLDPADGFPAGAPAGAPAAMSWHGYAHLAAGSVTFLSLIAACFLLGRHFRRAGDRSLAVGSRIAGTTLLLGNGWAMSGGTGGSLTLAVGVMTAMAWISVIAARYRRDR
ncbi:DUF998 domain-containing protein [Streptomyces sp. TRM66268-LWL]|uniref:DUF998 domain-containing protein n=1 Tax=Streptomyces polyasparticus TaxID=2767826 RepID=A0ABR7SJV7_9ACTN|nr:DUF998 domain-containing protein [Streptomyces polyasparticus]MBC9714761.1 DUF998 domain-containing protein [Streptomyces polyasparticus]